jgi:hypothetical protein
MMTEHFEIDLLMNYSSDLDSGDEPPSLSATAFTNRIRLALGIFQEEISEEEEEQSVKGSSQDPDSPTHTQTCHASETSEPDEDCFSNFQWVHSEFPDNPSVLVELCRRTTYHETSEDWLSETSGPDRRCAMIPEHYQHEEPNYSPELEQRTEKDAGISLLQPLFSGSGSSSYQQ